MIRPSVVPVDDGRSAQEGTAPRAGRRPLCPGGGLGVSTWMFQMGEASRLAGAAVVGRGPGGSGLPGRGEVCPFPADGPRIG